MAHQTRTRADETAWSTGALTPAELDHLDLKTFQSINGDEGGVWAPSSVIVIGGSGLEVTGPFVADAATIQDLTINGDTIIGDSEADTLTVNAATLFTGDVEFEDPTTFGSTVNFDGSINVNGNAVIGDAEADTLTVNAAATFTGDATFQDPVIFESTVNFDGSINVNGNAELGTSAGDAININGIATFAEEAVFDNTATFAADAVFQGATVFAPGSALTLNEVVQFTTSGRVPARFDSVSDANQTVTVDQGNVLDASISTTRSYTIDETGAVIGDFFFFLNSTIYNLNIFDPLSVSLVANLTQVDADQPGCALVIRTGVNSWKRVFVISG